MRFLRAFIPNLTIALNISVMIVVYLDLRNPMMGFLSGLPFLVMMGLCAACSVISAVILYGDWRNNKKSSEKKRSEMREKSE